MHVHEDPDLVKGVETQAAPDGDVHELAASMRAGSPDALAEIYRRWSTLVHTIALRSLGDPADAEDVVQQVFISAWNSRERLEPGQGSLAGWIVGITKHRIADVRTQRYRASRNVRAVAAEAATASVTTDDDWAERLLLVYELDLMGDPRASVLRMAFIDDRPQDEIAQVLGLPIGTVKSHVRRGLLELRKRLKEVEDVAP